MDSSISCAHSQKYTDKKEKEDYFCMRDVFISIFEILACTVGLGGISKILCV